MSREIQKALKAKYGADIFSFKIHGGPMMMAGLPDIVGFYKGQAFGLETKINTDVSPIQHHVHARMRRAGARIGVPHSVAEALEQLDAWFPTS